MSRFKFFLCLFGITAFMVGYGAATKAYPSGGVHGRGEHNGYRTNVDDSSGTYVLRQAYWGEAIRPNVEGDVDQFISFILNTKLDLDGNGSADGQDKRGATFIIHTMIGARLNPNERYSRPTPEQINKWRDLVREYDRRGLIRWRVNYTFNVNSMYQGTRDGPNPDDDAFYDDRGTAPSILFLHPTTRAVVYALKWNCANPVGTTSLPDIPRDFAMDADIETLVNGVKGTTAEAGDTITFRYTANNNGPGQATGVSCSRWSHNYAGYKVPPSWVEAGASPMPSMGCPPTFANGFVRTVDETAPATSNSGTMCRFLQVAPGSQSGGSARDVACVTVYTKPYFRVYGGDVQAGASFEPCNTSLPAGEGRIQAYSKFITPGGGYAGSGAEGAVMAYRDVVEFVSAGMRNVTTIPLSPRTPKGLTFANTPATGTYGGNFGAGTCIPDYWKLSNSPGAVINPGGYTVGGRSLGAGQKQDVFVNGDAYINGNIVYNGSWTLNLTTNTIPSFRLIVRGNIYIDDNVTQLDGVYVAMPGTGAAANKGLIYTCSLGAAPPTPEQVAYNCSNSTRQLRVNGSFIARGIKLLRTPNSLNNATVSETAAASRAGEIFTYSPDVWLALPQFRFSEGADYDAITTLPPVL